MSSKKEEFVMKILNPDQIKECHFNVMSRETYDNLISQVDEAKVAVKKTTLQYRRIKRFNIQEICGAKVLVTNTNPVKYYLAAEDVFDVIKEAHLATQHGGRDKIKIITNKSYANITNEMIYAFISLCDTCQQKKNSKQSKLPIVVSADMIFKSRCLVDVIDMTSRPDGDKKFVMVYKDVMTDFIVLRPLQTDNPDEVALQLTDIFLMFGAPCIIQSNRNSEFVSTVISQLATLWPELKIVCGTHLNAQEKICRDVEDSLSNWLNEIRTASWTYGIRVIQFKKNTTYDPVAKRTPFRAMFGRDVNIGLADTMLLCSEVMGNIFTEKDLQKALSTLEADDDVEKKIDSSTDQRIQSEANTSVKIEEFKEDG